MRRAFAGLMIFAITGGAGCSGAPPAPATPPPERAAAGAPRPDEPPGWLPVYTPQQLALLKPVDHTIQVPAARVFPDLQQFRYSTNRPLATLEEAFKFTKMAATYLNDSPRFYTLDAGPPEAANPIVQYGPAPPAEPDGLQIVKRGEGGRSEFVPAPLSAEARASFDKGVELAGKGDLDGATAAFRAALAKGAGAPAVHVALGDALLKAGKVAEAEAAYQASITADATFAPAHLGVATIADKRSDLGATKKSLAEALAYQPNSARALALANRIGGTGGRIAPFAIFLDVDSRGAIRAVSADNEPARMYAGCRAVMRYEPDLRAQIFEQPAETPYYLSVAEEVICLEAAIGAYMVARKEHPDAAPDPRIEDLVALAQKEGLSAYVMFEILGVWRPELARAAPPDVHREMARYVEQHVLGQKDVPDGVYNAGGRSGQRDMRLSSSRGHD